MRLQEGLGYKHLSAKEQKAYNLMLPAFSSMSGYIDFPGAVRDVDLMNIMHIALGDNPIITYFDKTYVRFEEFVRGKRMILTGVRPKFQAKKRDAVLNEISGRIISSLRAKAGDEYSILIGLYEFIQKTVKYDDNQLNAIERGRSISPDSHNAYGALVHNLAVCDGFSSAFSLLAKGLGFESMLVSGNSAYRSASFVEHAWNIIKVQDRYYHLDVTWDTRDCKEFDGFSYTYFLLSDKEIKRDHVWDRKMAPACSCDNLSYYAKNGLLVNNAAELKGVFKTLNKNHNKVFKVKLSDRFILPENPGDYLAQVLLKEIAATGKRVQISYTWDENVRCFFAKVC